ncbi:hypothetical protein F5X71_12410 [Nocardia brasiliensis]|uniref:Uncharacterized protein n=1 Tax=Nocardia brasiliensis TaxID=37326 RepID=A0A6G9XQ18_NOCBR|nr:hypothetical protein [Nocardia brasiliensis]QIS03008.1 hypothetical protein F5X71_12410 [Nocardia brasiliensis]
MAAVEPPDNTAASIELETTLVEVFADRIKFEHDIIGQRMSWLMTLNGFLIGGAAILSANRDRFTAPGVLTGALVIICLAGALSNASCLFSNWWAGKAMRDAADALADSWSDEARRRVGPLMRLYGRDPRAFRGAERPLPSEWLHPWFLLPTLFWLLYCTAALFATTVSGDRTGYWQANVLPFAVTFLLFVPLTLLDFPRHRKRRNECAIIEQLERAHGVPIARSDQRGRYRAERAAVRKWVRARQRGGNPVEVRRPRVFGVIPLDTHAEYLAVVRAEQLLPEPEPPVPEPVPAPPRAVAERAAQPPVAGESAVGADPAGSVG